MQYNIGEGGGIYGKRRCVNNSQDGTVRVRHLMISERDEVALIPVDHIYATRGFGPNVKRNPLFHLCSPVSLSLSPFVGFLCLPTVIFFGGNFKH